MPLKLCALSNSLSLQYPLGCMPFEISIDMPLSVGPFLLMVSNQEEAYLRGNPLSMLVAAAALGQWAARIPTPLKVNHVFVDDRLLLHDCYRKLQEVFDFTQNWDREHCFNAMPKTHAFGTNPIHQNVTWLDGETVKREEGSLIYLGVPLPFLSVNREKFYAPTIAKLCAALNKVARARIPFHQAATVVTAKVAPSLAYAAMIVRPTCKQLSVLRNHIYKACADRHFATHDAQALFLHRTHLHDPEAAMTYASLCGWRRALRIPFFEQWLRQHWPTHSIYFPMTLSGSSVISTWKT